MKRLAVTGAPILHSRSPQVFANLDLPPHIYIRLRPASWERVPLLARELGLDGINVTAPFKAPAARWATTDLESINTLLLEEPRPSGLSTDPEGVLEPLRQRHFPFRNARILLLGAGAAARSLRTALLDEGAKLMVANRSGLADDNPLSTLPSVPWQTLVEGCPACELIIHTAGMDPFHLGPPQGDVKPWLLDATYHGSGLRHWALRHETPYISGLEWLQAQGRYSAAHFFHISPPLARKPLVPPVDTPRQICLTGFMGAGKSTVGPELARALGWRFLDTDQALETRCGQPVAQIIREAGEAAFRREEARLLNELEGQKNLVLATGGGIPAQPGRTAWLRRSGRLTVFLAVEWQRLQERISTSTDRPLWNREASALYQSRMGAYLASAHLALDASGTPHDIREDLLDELHHAFPRLG